MSVSLVFESASCLAISAYADSAGQKRVFIYYDPSYPNSWYDISDSWFMARYIPYVLLQYDISSEVVDAEELARIVEDLVDASDTIIVMAHDVAPWTIWNGSQNSAIQNWIKAGGIITWTGDWEFYYIGYPNGSKVHVEGIESIVFGRPITSDTHIKVETTELGCKTLPSMEGFISLRPADASKLHGLQYEVYGEKAVDEVTFYDPILIRLGDGALAKIAMTCSPEIDALMRGVLMSEFVLNQVLNLEVKLKQPPNFGVFPKLVIGHYYNWYSGPPEWRHWRWYGGGPSHNPERIHPDSRRDIASAFYPLIGPYDSFDKNLIEYHIMLAKTCGIDAFAIDWYGPNSFEDYALSPLFEVAEERSFKLIIVYEPKIHFLWVPHRSRAEALRAIESDIKYIFRYTKRETYLSVQGKPVVFFYGVGLLSVDEWCNILDNLSEIGYEAFYVGDITDPKYFFAFNGLYEWISIGEVMTPAERLNEVSRMFNRSLAFFPNRIFGAGVWPGFNDTGVWGWGGGPGVYPRNDGGIYNEMWMVALESGAPWVIVMTFNEWNEGIQIEPAIEYGYLYMNITAAYASRFRGIELNMESIPIPKDIYDADVRVEEIAMEGYNVTSANEYLGKAKLAFHAGNCTLALNLAHEAIALAELLKNAVVALNITESTIDRAESEGRIQGLEEAKVLFRRAFEAYDAGDYEGVISLSQEAKEAAEKATLDLTNPTADAGSDRTVKVGTILVFNASGSSDNMGIVNYEWDYGDGSTGTGMISNHTYTEPRIYTIMLTVKDAAGNIDVDSITLTVEGIPAEFPWWIVGIVAAGVVAVAALILWRRSNCMVQSKNNHTVIWSVISEPCIFTYAS